MNGLFSKIKYKDMELKNRVVMAPMCMYSAGQDGKAKTWHYIHYVSRAIGGVGLILIEATAVEARGRISSRDLGLWEDSQISGLRQIVEECHRHGSKIGIQLGHAGRKCAAEGENIIAPTAVEFSEEYGTPKEMSKEDIKVVIQAFKNAAKRAALAGFDTIEIHGAHGYLINEFLSPLTNKRQDEYGGNSENRARFLKETIKAVREVWPNEKPIILRISAEDYDKAGNNSNILAEMINSVKDEGLDIINVSSGGVIPTNINLFPGYQIGFAEIVKEKTKLPVIAGGLITKAEMAEEILQNKRADLIFLGRELLRNPYWTLEAAKILRQNIDWPEQYERSKIK